MRNTKMNQANSINAAHIQVADERQSLKQEHAKIKESLKEEKELRKQKEDHFEGLQRKYK